jgi:hypothetical protein
MSFANGYHVGMFYKRIVYIHESVEPVLSPVPLVKAFALPCSSETSNANTTSNLMQHSK